MYIKETSKKVCFTMIEMSVGSSIFIVYYKYQPEIELLNRNRSFLHCFMVYVRLYHVSIYLLAKH